MSYILSGRGNGLGAVGVQDQQIFAAREFKKGDARPGGYKATGGHGGVLGTIGPPVTVWYAPTYRRGATSEVRLELMPSAHGDVRIKDESGALLASAIPRVHMVKYGHYMSEDATGNPDYEVDIMARLQKGLADRASADPGSPKLHGFVLEGLNPYGQGTESQVAALTIAAFSGMPTVQVGRADPGGTRAVQAGRRARQGEQPRREQGRGMLLMASLLRLGKPSRREGPAQPNRRRASGSAREGRGIPGYLRDSLALLPLVPGRRAR